MQRLRSIRGLAIGFALGVIVGSASVAAAAFAKQGWDRFGPMFKQGYVAGFIDCVRIAKALDPFSYIATQFPAPAKAKPIVWVRTIDDLYAKDEHKKRTLAQILIIAGTKLQKDFGEDETKPNDQRLESLRQAIDRQRRALLQARKTVQAAQDEIGKNGKASATNADAAKSDQTATQGEKSGDQAAEQGGNGGTGKPAEDAQKRRKQEHGAAPAAPEQKPDASGTSDTPPEGSHGMMPPGSHEMMPEGSHPDMPLKHPDTDSANPDQHHDED